MRNFPKPLHTFVNPNLNSNSVALVLLCIALLSCSTNTSVSPSTSSNFGVDQFPMAIGDSWTYAVYDSISNILDTISVTVEDPISADRQFASMWVFKGRAYHDTMYVLIEDNNLMMYENPLSLQPAVTIEFPLVEGASWGKKPDTSVVFAETHVAVPAGTFDDAFRVDRHAVSFNYRLDSHRWIVPNVGIVRWEEKEFNLGPAMNQRWVLIAYNHIQ